MAFVRTAKRCDFQERPTVRWTPRIRAMDMSGYTLAKRLYEWRKLYSHSGIMMHFIRTFQVCIYITAKERRRYVTLVRPQIGYTRTDGSKVEYTLVFCKFFLFYFAVFAPDSRVRIKHP